MITIQLTDTTDTMTLEVPTPPLSTTTIEGAVDVKTLDNNVSTYFTANKRQWDYVRSELSEDVFNELKGYFDRQFTLYKYPLLTISHFGISNVPVRMSIDSQNTIDNCGTVSDVRVTFRETRQL